MVRERKREEEEEEERERDRYAHRFMPPQEDEVSKADDAGPQQVSFWASRMFRVPCRRALSAAWFYEPWPPSV